MSLDNYLIFATVFFGLGVTGFLVRRNLIFVTMSVELMLVACTLLFIAFAQYTNTPHGLIFGIFIIMVTAAEAAIGASILVSLYRHKRSINTEDWTSLKG